MRRGHGAGATQLPSPAIHDHDDDDDDDDIKFMMFGIFPYLRYLGYFDQALFYRIAPIEK